MKHNDDGFDKKPKKLKHAKNVRGEGMRTLNEHQVDDYYLLENEDFEADDTGWKTSPVEVEPEILAEYLRKPDDKEIL